MIEMEANLVAIARIKQYSDIAQEVHTVTLRHDTTCCRHVADYLATSETSSRLPRDKLEISSRTCITTNLSPNKALSGIYFWGREVLSYLLECVTEHEKGFIRSPFFLGFSSECLLWVKLQNLKNILFAYAVKHFKTNVHTFLRPSVKNIPEREICCKI